MHSHGNNRTVAADSGNGLSQRALNVQMAITAFVAVACLTLVMAFSSVARADNGAEIVWTATKVEGKVIYREGGHPDTRWIPLRKGALLSALAELKTGTNGRAELSFEGSTIVAAPNSEFKLPGPTPKNAVYRVSQKVGTFLYKIKHATRDKFEVQTPFLTTIIKGTIFSVLAGPSGSSVHVTEGAVFVQPSTGTGGAFVRPGETARVAGTDRGKVTIQGATRRSGSSTTSGDNRRSDAAEPENRRGKPAKIVFRDVTRQAASLGDSAPVGTRNGNKKGKDASPQVDAKSAPDNRGPGNGNGLSNNGNASAGASLTRSNGNAGGGASANTSLGGGNAGANANAGLGGGLGNGGGNAGVGASANSGLGGGNSGGGNSGGGLGNGGGNVGGGANANTGLGGGNAGGGLGNGNGGGNVGGGLGIGLGNGGGNSGGPGSNPGNGKKV